MQTNVIMNYVVVSIDFIRAHAIVKYVMLGVGFAVSMLWGMLCFRYISLPMVTLFLVVFVTMPWHKNRKSIYISFALYLLTTVTPIDIRTPRFQYEALMPTVKIVPLIIGYPTDKNVRRSRAGEIYLGRDIGTGLEPKWVLLWQTDVISLTLNNYIDFYIKIGVLKV